jgi:hypothetical protein
VKAVFPVAAGGCGCRFAQEGQLGGLNLTAEGKSWHIISETTQATGAGIWRRSQTGTGHQRSGSAASGGNGGDGVNRKRMPRDGMMFQAGAIPAPLPTGLRNPGTAPAGRQEEAGSRVELGGRVTVEPGRISVDFSPLICHRSPMPRWNYTKPVETPRTVSASVLDALGRGFLIATASFLAGTMLGTAHLAVGTWTIGVLGVIAAGGVGCLVGSALVKNLGCQRWARKSGWSPHAGKAAAVEAAEEVAPEEWRARRRVMEGRQREHSSGRSV